MMLKFKEQSYPYNNIRFSLGIARLTQRVEQTKAFGNIKLILLKIRVCAYASNFTHKFNIQDLEV